MERQTWIIYITRLENETAYQAFSRWLNHAYDENNPEYGVPYCTGYGVSHGKCWIKIEF